MIIVAGFLVGYVLMIDQLYIWNVLHKMAENSIMKDCFSAEEVKYWVNVNVFSLM